MCLQTWLGRALFSAGLLLLSSSLAWGAPPKRFFQCGEPSGTLCTERADNPSKEYYIGHDEPALLFYSDVPGSGHHNIYSMRLPEDPPLLPEGNGSGGTWNFQLHPAFWFGMAMCDDQSDPNPGGSPGAGPNIPCTPDSDSNIYTSTDPKDSHYIGKHPGVAFMEMQFYPPGWITSNSGVIDAESATRWTAAITIDTFQDNANTGQNNNPACQAITGGEYVNFAYIQRNGIPAVPGSASPLGPFVSTNSQTLRMFGGDELIVTIEDTEHGLKVTIQDLTSGQTGFMVASAHNGFASVKWDPNGKDCNPATHNLHHDFHPAYATSSERTRVPGAAHSYNITFSDEIGHFEYCNKVAQEFGPCLSPNDKFGDDVVCVDGGFAGSLGLIGIGGCAFSIPDANFDGVPYRNNTWPGSFSNRRLDELFHAQPVIFSSPLLQDREGHRENFSRVAFETDLPRIESATNPPCQRHLKNPMDPHPGQGCVNPPVGAQFYPIFSTRLDEKGCRWQEGGRFLPNTLDDFGGTSKAEYGPLLTLAYTTPTGPTFRLNNFHRTLDFNPCPIFEEDRNE